MQSKQNVKLFPLNNTRKWIKWISAQLKKNAKIIYDLIFETLVLAG